MIKVDGSLKVRLAVWLLVTVTGLGALLMLEAHFSTRHAAERAYDSQLEAAALTIAEAVQWEAGKPIVEVPAAALPILATRNQERVFYAVLDNAGRRISSNLDLPIPPGAQARTSHHPTWRTLQHSGSGWRLYGREHDSAGWETQDPVQVWVGHTLGGRHELAATLFRQTVVRFLAMVLLAGLLMLLAMRVALTPMRRLRHLLRRRKDDDMRPLDARVPEELREMAETLDSLFTRQRASHDALLRFTADASHQLKTPLAGLQSISELALHSRNPDEWHTALVTVHEGTQRTSRLASQLLSLARLRHASDSSGFILIDLAVLLRDTVLDWAGSEAAAHHDLGLAELPHVSTNIRGEPWALCELLGNLIDNALSYTPPGSQITLGLEATGDALELYIEDNGPGVAPAVRERLLHPFERGGRQDTRGSGLGLAIVDSIARRHAARLVLTARKPCGLCVALHFLTAEQEIQDA
ncbi:MAG: sensor histidine kinase [Halomonadaceae bacterium]